VAATPRGAATRQLIVDATAALVARGGVAATSLDDVRAATGTSKSQLYHYFRGKADLVRAVVRHQADAVVSAQHLEDDPPDGEAGLQRWRYRVVAAQRARGFAVGCPLGSLVAELLGATSTDDAVRAELRDAFRRWRGLLAAGLRRGVEAGKLPPQLDVDAAAEALVAAVQGGTILAALTEGPAPLQAALDRAIADLLAG
jgi:TetR/AcrR family transcriptional regulator, transcriptional repressor for nem operon